VISFIVGIVGSIGKFFADVASAVFKWATAIFAYRLGQRRERQKRAEELNEVKDEQLEIISKPDADRRTLLDRMRKR
jgi:hypothetical protein